MQIDKQQNPQNNSLLTVALSGSLNTASAPELDASLADLGGVEELVFDLSALNYISSAGLRTLLLLHKKMSARGSMKVKNVPPGVMDVFRMSGFTKFLTIEE